MRIDRLLADFFALRLAFLIALEILCSGVTATCDYRFLSSTCPPGLRRILLKEAFSDRTLFGAAHLVRREKRMCRNIRTLFNFDPPATTEEVREASVQFVRKLSGFPKPSKANEAAFNRAVEDVSAAARALLDSLVTVAEPRNRGVEAARARARAAKRFGTS